MTGTRLTKGDRVCMGVGDDARFGVIKHDSHGVEALVAWELGGSSMERFANLRKASLHADEGDSRG